MRARGGRGGVRHATNTSTTKKVNTEYWYNDINSIHVQCKEEEGNGTEKNKEVTTNNKYVRVLVHVRSGAGFLRKRKINITNTTYFQFLFLLHGVALLKKGHNERQSRHGKWDFLYELLFIYLIYMFFFNWFPPNSPAWVSSCTKWLLYFGTEWY